MRAADNRPIGIFDSGVGGLSAVARLEKLLPNESFVYFGDTARLPYGSRTVETLRKYALQDARLLFEQGVKAVLVACGTASSNALDVLRENFDIPVTGVIDGACERACEIAKEKNSDTVAVLGTVATVKSGAFERKIKSINPDYNVISVACPMFVPLVENGYTDVNDEAANIIARQYLDPLKAKKPSAVILGCTHYPLISATVQKVLGDECVLVNSSEYAVKKLAGILREHNLCAGSDNIPEKKFFVSDNVEGFAAGARMFLGREIFPVKADADKY